MDGDNHSIEIVNEPDSNDEYSPLLPASSDHPRTLKRKRSDFSIKSINQTLNKWTKDISTKLSNWHLLDREIQPTPNEILYSVFKAPPYIHPITTIPSEGFTNSGPVTQVEFENIVREGIIAIEEFGIKPVRISAGSSGSYFIFNRNKEIIGVFKPKDEEPYGPLSPKWTKWIHRNLFPCFFGRSCLIPNTGFIAESAASLIDRQLQIFIVPYTDTVGIASEEFYYTFVHRWKRKLQKKKEQPKIGSFQLFLNDYKCADEFFRENPLPGQKAILWGSPNQSSTNSIQWTEELLQQLSEEVEKLVILDFIMRNTDRGIDNWMIKATYDETSGKHDIKIGAIDSGLSFPWKHPNEWRSFPFGWLFLPLSVIGRPFSQKTRMHFLKFLTSTKWWEDTSVLMREMFARDPGFSERMWKKQWAVLKGQAWNVVKCLETPGHGPLDLARRTRVLILDEHMEVPVTTPTLNMNNAMETPLSSTRRSSLLRHKKGNKISTIPEESEVSESESFTDNQSGPCPSTIIDDNENDVNTAETNRNLQENWRQYLSGEIDKASYKRNEALIQDKERVSPFKSIADDSNSPVLDLLEPSSKTVIIERIQKVSGRPPVFTCC